MHEQTVAGKSINCAGRILDLNTPAVMGIVNLTPDSFFAQSRIQTAALTDIVGQMLENGAFIIDLGACSTRPGAAQPCQTEEAERLLAGLEVVCGTFPEAIVSVDTYRSLVAELAIKAGASMVNDVSGGRADADMYGVVARAGLPYVLTHSRGTPQTMQSLTQYQDLLVEIMGFFAAAIHKLEQMGVCDIILDPGIGFAKDAAQNFTILKNLNIFAQLPYPLLVGVSRKSFISKCLNVEAQHSLNGTTAVHTHALMQGANILRVHDVLEARQAIQLFEAITQS